MAIPNSIVANVLGITSEHVDLREGQAALLPQQIYVVGQGNEGMEYPLTKWRATTHGAAAARFGWGSPLHAALEALLPPNGDGVGTIPVWLLPLDAAESAIAAAGQIDISGTAAKAGAYRAVCGGVESEQFVIPAGVVDESAVCALMHSAISRVSRMPVIPTYDYASATSEVTRAAGTPSDGTIGSLTTTGQPKPGVWLIECTAEAANAGTFTVTDPDGVLVATHTTMGAKVSGGLGFTLSDGTEDFNVGDLFEVTVAATGLNLTAKWKGESGNWISLDVIGDTEFGVVFTVTEMTGGLVNPSVQPALDLIGSDWATMLVNTFNPDDSDAKDEYQEWGEGRWGVFQHQPAVVFVGSNVSDGTEAALPAVDRELDRINVQLTAPDSPDMPHVIAAREVARIAKQANQDPPVDYCRQAVAGLKPGAFEWDLVARDAALKAGISTSSSRAGVVFIEDVVTHYRPEEEQPPGYRFVVDIVRTQNVIYNLWLEFSKPQWAAAPLVADDEPVRSRSARKPKSIRAAVEQIIDGLADAAIITNRAAAKASIQVTIDGPRKFTVEFVTPYSGNTAVKDIRHKWGFFYG